MDGVDAREASRRRVVNLVVFAGALALALVLAEVVARMSGLAPVVHRLRTVPESAYQVSENPVLGYELKRNYRNDEPDFQETFFRTNAYGQRDIDRDVAKPDGVRRIVLLGDSVVVGHGLERIDDTISRQMESLLQARGGDQEYEVLGFGGGGYGTQAELELLKTRVLQFDPDMVILLFVDNDFEPENAQIRQYRISRPAGVEPLFVHSALFRLVALRLDLFGLRSEVDPEYMATWHKEGLQQAAEGAPAAEGIDLGESAVAKGLAAFEGLGRSEGFQTLVALWPRFEEQEIHHRQESLDGERLARHFGLRVVRLAPTFRAHWAIHEEGARPQTAWEFYTWDRIHPNDVCAGVAAEFLVEDLLRVFAGAGAGG